MDRCDAPEVVIFDLHGFAACAASPQSPQNFNQVSQIHRHPRILELERATGRLLVGAARRQGDGAAPLIGSSEAIRRVRERIERVAAPDFTILIGGIRSRTAPQLY